MGVASLKYKSCKDVPTDRPLTIGVSGLGVTTHLVALQLSSRFPNLQVIPFKSTNDAILATAGGQIDLTMGFLNDELKWTTSDTEADKRLTILGITGDKSINGIPTLASEGFSKTLENLNAPHHLVVPTTVSDEKFKEWREILFKASKAKSVQDSYTIDYAVPLDSISNADIQKWYNKQNALWKKLSLEVNIKQ
jgi:tripartite-type tricarboxylate transporter receptor subunit TctC